MGQRTGILLYPPGRQRGVRQDPTKVGKWTADEDPQVTGTTWSGMGEGVDLVGAAN